MCIMPLERFSFSLRELLNTKYFQIKDVMTAKTSKACFPLSLWKTDGDNPEYVEFSVPNEGILEFNHST